MRLMIAFMFSKCFYHNCIIPLIEFCVHLKGKVSHSQTCISLLTIAFLAHGSGFCSLVQNEIGGAQPASRSH